MRLLRFNRENRPIIPNGNLKFILFLLKLNLK